MQVQVIKSGNQTLQVKKRGFFFEEDNDACILKSYMCGWLIELTICFKIFCRTYLIFQALNTFCLSLTDHMWLFLLQKLFSSNFFEREASFFKSVHIIPEFLSGIRFIFYTNKSYMVS